MKSFVTGKMILGALSLCAAFGVTAAQAAEFSIRVDVPFQFVAGEKSYPAGDYSFTVYGDTHTLKIVPGTNKSIAMVPLTASTERRSGAEVDKAVVRFSKSGDVHVLAGVWN